MNEKLIQYKCALYRMLINPVDLDDQSILKALELVAKIVGARIGYIRYEDASGQEIWSAAHCDDLEIKIIQQRISSTIIKEALDTGQTIVTPSAVIDERFCNAQSVMQSNIESVLCSPLSNGSSKGVIYLQGKLAGLCSKENIDEAELFSQSLRPVLERLKYHRQKTQPLDDLRSMYDLEGIIGESPAFKKVLNEAMTVAPLNVPLLINGETGTGKTHLAKVIHRNSSRKEFNFIHINCANLPEKLFESELFGAAKGAFSGAIADIKGKVYAANKGTLFLDEISEMPIAAQAKLLQFLDEGFYYPLGSNKPVYPDVRIIVASNVDFQEQIDAGSFRKDLYYRISNFPLVMPPIRERTADLQELAVFLIKNIESKMGEKGYQLSTAAMTAIKAFGWPGNIRELQNKIHQGIIKAKITGSLVIDAKHIFQGLVCDESSGDELSFAAEKDKWEKQFIEDQLLENSWNITRTAAILKMSRSHLNRLIKVYSLAK